MLLGLHAFLVFAVDSSGYSEEQELSRLSTPAITFAEHLNVQDVAFADDGKTIYSVSTEHGLTRRIWDARSGELLDEVELESDLHGNFFLTGSLKFDSIQLGSSPIS